LLTYFTAVSELFTDKYKLVHQVKRPIPKSEFTLKIWGNILSGLSYLSIFVNTALLCFGSKSVDVFAKVVLKINPYYKEEYQGTSIFNLLLSGIRGKDESQ
jgi:hypothetical protein